MSRPPDDSPERLLGGDATDFERRVLEAALRKNPSPAVSARMASALGVAVTAVGTGGVAAAEAAAAPMGASKAAVTATGTTAVWPWVVGGILGLVAAGAVVGARVWRGSPPPEPRQAAPSEAAPRAPAPPTLPSAPSQPAPVAAETAPGPAAAVVPGGGGRTPATGDLANQIAFIDAARAATAAGDGRRALQILRRYQSKYPAGSFRPEATGLTVEALVRLGRDAEARALAERFVTEHRGSLLAKRVAEIAGLGDR
jgi:hypothetical protein